MSSRETSFYIRRGISTNGCIRGIFSQNGSARHSHLHLALLSFKTAALDAAAEFYTDISIGIDIHSISGREGC